MNCIGFPPCRLSAAKTMAKGKHGLMRTRAVSLGVSVRWTVESSSAPENLELALEITH